MKRSLIMLSFVLTTFIWARTAFAMEDPVNPDAGTEYEAKTLTFQFSPEDISPKGNVKLAFGRKELEDAGYSFGDMLTVEIDGQAIDMPFGSSFSDVDSGSPALVCRDQDEAAKLFVNMGNFAEKYLQGIWDEETGKWNFPEGTELPFNAKIFLEEKGGYLLEYWLHSLSYTNERKDYRHLTDEEFGNFREVITTGMGDGILYRCSSPIDPKIGRSSYVDRALKDAGVTVVMNLADTAEAAENYEGFKDSYYAATDYICLNCSMNFTDESFADKLTEGLEFFADHPGVYAVHCLEGKDRTGIVIALLECLMGADIYEVVDDYMTTFYNLYDVNYMDVRYDIIAESNICKSLKNMFGINDLESADLSKCAGEYLTGIGMSPETIETLKKNLSADAGSLSPAK